MAGLCHNEEQIVAAVMAGNLTEAQSSHLENCPECRAAAVMTGLMQAELRRAPAESSEIPSAEIIWLKASFERHKKRALVRRIVILFAAIIGVIAGLAMALVIWPSGATISPVSIIPKISLPGRLIFPAAISAAIVSLMLYIEHISNPRSVRN